MPHGSHERLLNLEGRTIRIAIGVPLSGSSARLGAEMKQAIDLALEERNASGGMFGASLVGETIDDEGKVQRAEAVAGELIRTFKRTAYIVSPLLAPEATFLFTCN